MVLSGLPVRSNVRNRHTVPLPHGIPRGRSVADGRRQTEEPLHELDYVLHRLPVLAATRLPVSIHWVQLDPTVVPYSENLPVLGVHGPHRAAHQLPEPDTVGQSHPLPAGDISLERMSVPYHLQEQRVRQQKLGVHGLGHRRTGHGQTVPAKLLLVHAGVDHHRRPAQAQEQWRVRLRHMPAIVWPAAVRHRARPCGQYSGQRQCRPKRVPR